MGDSLSCLQSDCRLACRFVKYVYQIMTVGKGVEVEVFLIHERKQILGD